MPSTRYPRSAALAVARELCAVLMPVTLDLKVAGSLRRRKAEVGDVEIVFMPRREYRMVDLLHGREFDMAAAEIDKLLDQGVIRKREGESGHIGWGPKNKLAVHVASGIPVDFFATTAECWWNYIVCRTGPRELNEAIARAAKAKGWTWNSYGCGFTEEGTGRVAAMKSERAVFDFAGLAWMEPWER